MFEDNFLFIKRDFFDEDCENISLIFSNSLSSNKFFYDLSDEGSEINYYIQDRNKTEKEISYYDSNENLKSFYDKNKTEEEEIKVKEKEKENPLLQKKRKRFSAETEKAYECEVESYTEATSNAPKSITSAGIIMQDENYLECYLKTPFLNFEKRDFKSIGASDVSSTEYLNLTLNRKLNTKSNSNESQSLNQCQSLNISQSQIQSQDPYSHLQANLNTCLNPKLDTFYDLNYSIDEDEIFKLPSDEKNDQKNSEKYLIDLISLISEVKKSKIFNVINESTEKKLKKNSNYDDIKTLKNEKKEKKERKDYQDKEINKRFIRKPLELIINSILNNEIKSKEKLELADFSKDIKIESLKNLHKKTIEEIFTLDFENEIYMDNTNIEHFYKDFLNKKHFIQFKFGKKKLEKMQIKIIQEKIGLLDKLKKNLTFQKIKNFTIDFFYKKILKSKFFDNEMENLSFNFEQKSSLEKRAYERRSTLVMEGYKK